MAGVSSAAFIVYTSANPVPGAEESTLQYFYVLLAANCMSIVIAFVRCRLARTHSMTISSPANAKTNRRKRGTEVENKEEIVLVDSDDANKKKNQ
eukprot:CAMPEP_0114416998 /NCGR_PEP_ID=MMETSP0103-20121206/2727_1 /TAXON_ID=37642 ORGANISM="Paraphysomonas imperforata, Strain PA2" /NCGR_SAMPLE_ID=MMETSP0103 /ASSEMBLY_ACC=CAM_ASM_000201 /LENGTH=94 /DNA_ID=CAMNT_0001585257 /DNA_START=85 /DNA_END=369 /DNA_ORIENTATION=-